MKCHFAATKDGKYEKFLKSLAAKAVENEAESQSHDILSRGFNMAFLAIARVSKVKPATIQKAMECIRDEILPEWNHYYEATADQDNHLDTDCDAWLIRELGKYDYPYSETERRI